MDLDGRNFFHARVVGPLEIVGFLLGGVRGRRKEGEGRGRVKGEGGGERKEKTGREGGRRMGNVHTFEAKYKYKKNRLSRANKIEAEAINLVGLQKSRAYFRL
jgi:hypothetical protein